MIFWILYLLISIILLSISVYTNKRRNTNASKYIFVLWIIYFSGFRNGLGFDYESYLIRLDYYSDYGVLSWLDEPFFNILAAIINTTSLSNVFYFVTMSAITLSLIIFKFYKFPFPFYSILLFLLAPGFGLLQSFNGIRQFAAVAFFFLASKYILDKNLIKYTISILLGFLFHKSIIFLFPLYFISNRKWSSTLLLFVLITSLLFPNMLLVIFSYFPTIMGDYSGYLDYINKENGSSILFLILNFMFIIFIFNKKFFEEGVYQLIFNMSYLCIIFYNFSANNIIFSRFALYFSPFLCVLLAMPNKQMPYYKIYRGFSITLFIVVFLVNLYQGLGDPLFFPDTPQILPLNSIFD